MTLKEAHEIQRRELISLRAENARLKKQLEPSFPVEEKLSLERHVRHLEQVIQTKDKRYESLRQSNSITQKQFRDLNLQILDLQERVKELETENAELKHRAESAEAEVKELNGTNQKLNARLNINFENSSLPSSALPFRKKVTNNRKPSGKKPGGQPHHKGNTRKQLPPTREPIIIPPPENYLSDPDIYPTGKQLSKQLIDISVNVIVQDYITDEFRKRSNGTRVHAPFPEGIVNNVNYGPSLKGFAFLLNNYFNVSVAKTRQCISDLTYGVIKPSTGMISNLSKEFSLKTAQDRKKIFSLLHHSDTLYSDATVSNVNGTRKAVILTTDKENVLYQHLDHKGHDGLEQTPVNDCKSTLVHDHDKSYYSYGSHHQECLAHVLRYLVAAQENEPELTWHKKMHSHLQKMIHKSKKSKSGIPPDKKRELKMMYFSILDLADKEYSEHPPDPNNRDGFNLQKRLREYANAHLYFLDHPDVDYTNNISERELRKFKRKQKQAVVFRSTRGAECVCDALTIIETARMQNQCVFSVVKKAFQKNEQSSNTKFCKKSTTILRPLPYYRKVANH